MCFMKIKAIVIVFIILLGLISNVYGFEINMEYIGIIESSTAMHPYGDPMAYNENSQATGKYQVTPICLVEFKDKCRWLNGSEDRQLYTMLNMYEEELCYNVASWYINERIPQMLKIWNLEDTIKARLACYNWGPGNYRKYVAGKKTMPNETKNYIKKYCDLLKRNG